MNGLTFIVLLCVGFSRTALAETQCTQYDYDRKLLEQLVRVEAQNKEYTERLSELEVRFQDLKQDMEFFANNVREEIKDVITDVTTNKVVTIPEVEEDGWELVFRATAGNNYNVFLAWVEGIEATSVKPENMKRSLNRHYRNNIAMASWEARHIEQVKYSLFENEVEVAYIIFNGTDSTRDSWFNPSLVLSSSWPTLLLFDETYNFFSVAGHPEVKRRFFINHNYGGCPLDKGYTVIVDTGIATQHTCSWDDQPSFPQILYSKINGLTIWDRPMFGRADYAAVYVR